MTPEEQEFHDKWLAIFIELERETVFGIGFNPRSIEQYTPEVVTKCMATYRSRKRFRPTPLFRSLVKWTLGLGTAVCVTLVVARHVLETSLPFAASVIVKQAEVQTDMSTERLKILKKLVATEAYAESQRLKAVKLQQQKEAREEADRKAAAAKKAATESDKNKACKRARKFMCDSINDNIFVGSIYAMGKRIQCTVTLNARHPDANCYSAPQLNLSKGGKWAGPRSTYNLPVYSIEAK